MNNLILLILCFIAGMLLRRYKRMPDNVTLTLEVLPANAFISGRIVCPGGNPCQVESPPDAFNIVASNDLIYNRTELDPSYSFILPVVEGWYEVSLTTEDPRLIAPHLPPIYVSPGDVVDLGDIEFLPRNAAISGSLQNEFGDPVPDVPLHFWSADGSFADWTSTNACRRVYYAGFRRRMVRHRRAEAPPAFRTS